MADIKGTISRTFFDVQAIGYAVNGIDENGLPIMVEVKSDYYITVNPNDKTQAKREVKKYDKRVIPDTVRVVVLSEEVRAMTLEDFYMFSTAADRQPNGRIK